MSYLLDDNYKNYLFDTVVKILKENPKIFPIVEALMNNNNLNSNLSKDERLRLLHYDIIKYIGLKFIFYTNYDKMIHFSSFFTNSKSMDIAGNRIIIATLSVYSDKFGLYATNDQINEWNQMLIKYKLTEC